MSLQLVWDLPSHLKTLQNEQNTWVSCFKTQDTEFLVESQGWDPQETRMQLRALGRPASCPGEVLRLGPGCWTGGGRAQGRARAGRCWHRKVECRTGPQRAWSWVCSPLQTEEDEGSDGWQSVTRSAPAQPKGWHSVEERQSLNGWS